MSEDIKIPNLVCHLIRQLTAVTAGKMKEKLKIGSKRGNNR